MNCVSGFTFCKRQPVTSASHGFALMNSSRTNEEWVD